ncbi:MAG: hypothetical protein AAB414_05540 [Patescibacteria group bacterium]
MGKEQGSLVPEPIIDLPPYRDLIDLRVPRAFRVWRSFRERHESEIESIGVLTPERVAILSNELATSVGHVIGNRNENADPVDATKLTQLQNLIAPPGRKIVFMRHGEQDPPEWIASIEDPAVRKVRMMQNPFNKQDCLTNKGFVNVFATVLSLYYLVESTGKKLRIFSSENRRAEEVAGIMSYLIPNSTFSIEEGLDSISYRDENDDPPATLEQILEDLPSGNMPWIPQLVDKWSKRPSDENQSVLIAKAVAELMAMAATEGRGSDLTVVLTHSQQLAETLRYEGVLENPHIRFPELTMIAAVKAGKPDIFPAGVLEENDSKKDTSMRKILERSGRRYEWYRIRRVEYETGQKIPFLVAHEPLNLTSEEVQEVDRIGRDVTDFIYVSDELYHREETVKGLLDRGKPEFFQDGDPQYLFVRPDILLTKTGMTVCEIETSPFGLSLAELLNRAYVSVGFDTLVKDGVLRQFLTENTPREGTVLYSRNTSSYFGQLEYLAKEILSGQGRNWQAQEIGFDTQEGGAIYRAFYAYELYTDLFVNNAVHNILDSGSPVFPSFTPHMEEKALLALIWDTRWEPFFKARLGQASFNHLREVIPPSWIVDQEQFFAPGLPFGVQSSKELASLSASKRKFVLKKSGFSSGSSWSEGVIFLQECSHESASNRLAGAEKDQSCLYVVQSFRDYAERPMIYEGYDGSLETMSARIRLTPYFSMAGQNPGQLLAIKATGCEKTNYVHVSTVSVNAAVAQA